MIRKRASIAVAAALGLLAGAANPAPPSPAAAANYGFRACAGFDRARVQPIVERLFDAHPETRAVLLAIDDCPAIKAYAPGYDDATRFISWSMAKTVTAMLAGAAVADGRLALDAPVPFPELRDRGVTLRHLLHMASGTAHVEVGDPVENSDTNQVLFVSGTQAMANAALDQRQEVPPGTRFEYNSLSSILISEAITRKLTNSRDPRTRAAAYRRYAQERLFGPAGVTSAALDFDGAGTQVGGSIQYMTLDDWGRMGALLIDGRAADGARVIAPEWLAFMKTPSPNNAEYGGHVWLNRRSTARDESALFPGKGPETTVAMNGHLGQLVIAAEGMSRGARRRLVLVRLGNTPDGRNPELMATLGDIVQAIIPAGGTAPRSR